MAWDFETDPEYQEKLDWVAEFVREKVEPLDYLFPHQQFERLDGARRAIIDPLKDEVRAHGMWATHLGPELGGQGFGQLKLALLNEILGRSMWASVVFGTQAPDTGNAEIIAHYGTDEQKHYYLPRLARESRAVGIRELNVWGGIDPFRLPLRLPTVLGARAEFVRAMRQCRQLGVNVSLMLSIHTLDAETGRRFGTGGKTDAGWSYHTEAVPAINPGYYVSYAGYGVDPSNRKWQAEVLKGIRGLLRSAPFSICWDQYVAGQKDRSIDDLARAIFASSRAGIIRYSGVCFWSEAVGRSRESNRCGR